MPLKKLAAENKSAILRTILIFSLILLAAALRLAPHPWNFTPIGAIAIFAGATVRDRRLAFLLPLLIMFATDAIIGFNLLSPLVYLSFLLSVLIARMVVGPLGAGHKKRVAPAIAAATFLGSLQFFLITNFGAWAFLGSYPHTAQGLAACYIAGVPFFLNTLASDVTYATILFTAFFLAERFAPRFRDTAVADL